MLGHGEWKDVFKAVQDGDTELVGLYLKLGIQVNYQHPEYLTGFIHESIRRKNLHLLELLIASGADIHLIEAESGKSPLQLAQEFHFSEAIDKLGSIK
jgi:hypothetical protein